MKIGSDQLARKRINRLHFIGIGGAGMGGIHGCVVRGRAALSRRLVPSPSHKRSGRHVRDRATRPLDPVDAEHRDHWRRRPGGARRLVLMRLLRGNYLWTCNAILRAT